MPKISIRVVCVHGKLPQFLFVRIPSVKHLRLEQMLLSAQLNTSQREKTVRTGGPNENIGVTLKCCLLCPQIVFCPCKTFLCKLICTV